MDVAVTMSSSDARGFTAVISDLQQFTAAAHLLNSLKEFLVEHRDRADEVGVAELALHQRMLKGLLFAAVDEETGRKAALLLPDRDADSVVTFGRVLFDTDQVLSWVAATIELPKAAATISMGSAMIERMATANAGELAQGAPANEDSSGGAGMYL